MPKAATRESAVTISAGPRLLSRLDALRRTGLHGSTREEVARTLVQRGIEDAISKGLIPARRAPGIRTGRR